MNKDRLPGWRRKFPRAFMVALIVAAAAAWSAARVAGPGPENAEAPANMPEPQADVDEIYAKAHRAFQLERREEAADYLIQAARMDWRILAVLRDVRFQGWLPSTPPSEQVSLKPSSGGEDDPAPEVLYRLANIERNQAARLGRKTEAEQRKIGHYFLERLLADFPQSEWTDDAALLLLEDGFCLKDMGYPECVSWEVRGYEGFLEKYPAGDTAPRLYLKVADLYLELARRYERPSPWQSETNAELCRGRAIQVAGIIIERFPGDRKALEARNLIKEIKASGKPYSIIPPELL